MGIDIFMTVLSGTQHSIKTKNSITCNYTTIKPCSKADIISVIAAGIGSLLSVHDRSAPQAHTTILKVSNPIALFITTCPHKSPAFGISLSWSWLGLALIRDHVVFKA